LQQLSTPSRSIKNAAESPYFFQGDDNQDVTNWLTACEDYFDRNPYQWENHSHRIVFALGKTKGNKVAPFVEKYRKVIGGIGGFTRDPDYATWERFRQEIIKRYIGIEEERRALDKMDRISDKGKIDTNLLLLENLNIKAGLSGIALRVRVESKLPQEILPRLSHFSFATDEEWMEILRKVGRQEEELLERGKLTKSLTTPHAPSPKRKREEPDKGFNTKYEKRGSDNKAGKGSSRWKAPRNNTAKIKNNTVAKDKHTDWKKAHDGIKDDVVEKRKKEKRCTRCSMDNHTWRKCHKPILVAATFAYKNRGNPKQPCKPRTSTLAVHQPPPARQEPPAKVNLIRRERPSQIWELSDKEILANNRALVKIGLAIAVPEGTYGRIAPRSGLVTKGVLVDAGVIDADYRGEVKVLLVNQNSMDYEVRKGDRIAQLIVERLDDQDWMEVEELDVTETRRAEKDFGSSGLGTE